MLRLARTRAESRTTSQHRRKERGQSLIEFALTAPILIVLLLGLVEMGHAFNSYMTVVAAARDAARMGSQLGDGATAKDTIKNLVVAETTRLENAPLSSATPNCGTANPNISICSATQSNPSGLTDKWIDVKVCYNHTMIVGRARRGRRPDHDVFPHKNPHCKPGLMGQH